MIEDLFNELLTMDVSNENFSAKYNILLNNINKLNNEQLKTLKKIVLKKLEYDSGVYEQEIERIK